jgi:hypothetical protein
LLQKELIPVEFVKDLGVMFDSNLSFDKHILATVSSCMSKLGQISRAKHAFSKDLLVKIINALVFSKLFYCSSVWSNTSNSNIRKLQSVQNFAARIVSGRRKFDHITPVLKELRWLRRLRRVGRFDILVTSLLSFSQTRPTSWRGEFMDNITLFLFFFIIIILLFTLIYAR